MVAVVNPSKSLRNALHYNENKVKEGQAKLIHAAHYAKDIERLGFTDKFGRLQKLNELNDGVDFNTLHISLNFDVSEQLPEEKLKEIADAYMHKIGFGEQPYLVYQHHDAGHPHIHIITNTIKANGKSINLHNIGKVRSSKARREIEKEFNLVVADDRKQKEFWQLKPVDAQKVQYGKSETKRAITNVLDAVIDKYKYTSIAELNVVLKQYNVLADRGSEDSRTYKNNGLVFRVLNEQGEKIGVPIKASHIYSEPTLKKLEGKFADNEKARQPFKQRIKNAVDLAIASKPGITLHDLSETLKKDRISLVIRQNDKGQVYGLTYVDHEKKAVFNGSDLDKQYKQYSAKAILERLQQNLQAVQRAFQSEQATVRQDKEELKAVTGQAPLHVQIDRPAISPGPTKDQRQPEVISNPDKEKHTLPTQTPFIKNPIEILIQPEEGSGSIASELREEQKRKRKRKKLNQ